MLSLLVVLTLPWILYYQLFPPICELTSDGPSSACCFPSCIFSNYYRSLEEMCSNRGVLFHGSMITDFLTPVNAGVVTRWQKLSSMQAEVHSQCCTQVVISLIGTDIMKKMLRFSRRSDIYTSLQEWLKHHHQHLLWIWPLQWLWQKLFCKSMFCNVPCKIYL